MQAEEGPGQEGWDRPEEVPEQAASQPGEVPEPEAASQAQRPSQAGRHAQADQRTGEEPVQARQPQKRPKLEGWPRPEEGPEQSALQPGEGPEPDVCMQRLSQAGRHAQAELGGAHHPAVEPDAAADDDGAAGRCPDLLAPPPAGQGAAPRAGSCGLDADADDSSGLADEPGAATDAAGRCPAPPAPPLEQEAGSWGLGGGGGGGGGLADELGAAADALLQLAPRGRRSAGSAVRAAAGGTGAPGGRRAPLGRGPSSPAAG
jgi:hypothetical protein